MRVIKGLVTQGVTSGGTDGLDRSVGGGEASGVEQFEHGRGGGGGVGLFGRDHGGGGLMQWQRPGGDGGQKCRAREAVAQWRRRAEAVVHDSGGLLRRHKVETTGAARWRWWWQRWPKMECHTRGKMGRGWRENKRSQMVSRSAYVCRFSCHRRT
jgi:hypothetical protein